MPRPEKKGRSQRPSSSAKGAPPRPRTTPPSQGTSTSGSPRGGSAGSSRSSGSSADRSSRRASDARRDTGSRKASDRTSKTGRAAATSAGGAGRSGSRSGSARASSSRSGSTRRRTSRRIPADVARASAAKPAQPPRAGLLAEGRLRFGGIDVSVRVLGFMLLLALLAVLLVPSLYDWARQEQDYRAIQQRVAAATERNQEMRRELDLWDDPEFITSQARTRLGYLKPGETQYSVADPGDEAQSGGMTSITDTGPRRPWVQVIAESVTQADHPER